MEFYHYRSIDSALKELEGTFYFASREELNDPMESYLQVYWQGDKAAWGGLFRNYICSLYYAIALWLAGADDYEIRNNTLIIDPERLHSVSVNKTFKELEEEFISDKQVQEIVSAYGDDQVQVNKKNMQMLLFLVHNKALVACFKKYIDNSIVLKDIIQLISKLFDVDTLSNSKRPEILENLHLQQLHDQEHIIGTIGELFDDKKELLYISIGLCDENFLHNFDNKITTKYTIDITDRNRELIRQIAVKLFASKENTTNEERELMRQIFIKIFSNGNNLSYEEYRAAQHRNLLTVASNFSKIYVEQLINVLYPQNYVVCFSTSNNNSVMWGNYAKNHTGVCLVYESDDKQSISVDYQFNDKKNPLKFQKVIYGGEVEKRNFFETLGRLTLAQVKRWFSDTNGLSKCFDILSHNENNWRTQYWKTFNTKICKKLESWSYEEEYRLIIEDSFYRYPSSDDRKLKYDVKALKGVIFGIKTSEYDKCQIIKKILKNKKIGDDFQFWQAEYNDEKQTIEIREKLWKLKDFRGKVVSE